ncbi:hypothetical protein KAT84_04630, partial [Candidatus Bipolaricaulota bacterium]|nr:hypothetical protein [Candidatus Bipolaricaulota bacterium]
DLAWRILPLSGVLAPLTVDVPLQFEPNALSLNTWWVTWSETPTFDHLLIERDADDTVLHRDADVVYPLENEFGLSMQLPDEGAVLELLGSSGCLVDAVNIGGLPGINWPAGATVPPASMERTDLFVGDDLTTNWHTNLGLVRVGFDAFGNLLQGTPKVTNSPILDLAVQGFAFDVSSYPVGVPIVILFGDDAIYPADPQLWNVVVTSGNGDVQPAAWDVGKVEGGDTNVTVFTSLLQLDVRLHLWIRTPTGDVLFAPILVYPY